MTEAKVDYSGGQTPDVKVYMGRRWTQDDNSVMVAVIGPQGWNLNPLRHLVHHSPTGMEWGYAGSGPADLALSILADHFGETPTKGELHRGEMTVRCGCDEGRGDRGFDEGCERCFGSGEATEPLKCWTYHHPFKDAFCGRWGRSWAITGDDIDHWLAGLKGSGGRPAHTYTAWTKVIAIRDVSSVAQAAADARVQGVDPDEVAARDEFQAAAKAREAQEEVEF